MNSRLAMISFIDGGGGVPDNTLPGAPVYPSHGLPPGAVQLPVFPFDPTRPDQGLPPSPGRPDQGLPGEPPAPDQGLPGAPPRPSHPIAIAPGARFVVKWLTCVGLILVPDNSLPTNPAQPK